MAENTNPEFGRKIFFLNPSYKIKHHVITELREQEYEVYEIENYKYAKNILRHNPESILFVNTDSTMVLTTWLSFLKTFADDDRLKTTKIGILSERIDQDKAQLFFDSLDIDAGITSLSGDLTKVLDVIKGILDMLGAKGRRNYVRYSCVNDKSVQMFWTYSDKMHQFKVLDLSSVTLAVRIPSTLPVQLHVSYILDNAQVVLGTRVISMRLITYLLKDSPHGKIAIFLYDRSTSATLKTTIKEFISQSLQKQLIMAINSEAEDSTDYIALAKQDLQILELEEKKKNSKSKDTSKTETEAKSDSEKKETTEEAAE
ncbi:MAG: hypothetical protein IJ828_11485 [Treponema sp.]|nr:hypothetical protein [Treponema sp.]